MPELSAIEKKINTIKHNFEKQKLNMKLEEQQKNDMVMYLAHDLKTPLASVIGYLHLLRDEEQISEELRQKYLSVSLDKAEYLEDLINEFFEIAKFNLSNITLQYTKAGESVGYGRSFTARRDTRIAMLPIGYGDGFPRNLSDGKTGVLINHHIVPIAGRICMDQLAVDITDAEGVLVGDIATLVGEEGYDELSAASVAECYGSISNELLCRMGGRLPFVCAI